jgi:uncharacterized protein with FMN-binding domain
MKRALIVGTGTVMGVAAVLALNPDGASVAAGLPTSSAPGTSSTGSISTGSTGTGSTGTGSTAAPQPRATATGGSAAGGATTATGPGVDVGYGIVQVKVTLAGGKISAIDAVQLPQNDGHSARISQQAWPMLVDQALQAQSSAISGVSGASYTSYGFTESLKAALVSLGHAA